MDLEWNYAPRHADRTCRICIKNYIENLLLKFGHPKPTKPQHSPHKHREIKYGAKEQLTQVEASSPALDLTGVRRIQAIIGTSLFYGRAVDNKLPVAINAIGSRQSKATESTRDDVSQLLDYLATYHDDGIVYRASDMILAAHSDAGFHNESKGRSRAGVHIFLSENDPIPRQNHKICNDLGCRS